MSTIPPVSEEEERVRRCLAVGICPVCGRGPYVVVGIHAQAIHGLDKWDLRAMGALRRADSICDFDHGERIRQRMLANPITAPRNGRGRPKRQTPAFLRKQHGRGPAGEASASAKLNDAAVLALRERYATGQVTQSELAEESGISQNSVAAALRGETWKHVGGPLVTPMTMQEAGAQRRRRVEA